MPSTIRGMMMAIVVLSPLARTGPAAAQAPTRRQPEPDNVPARIRYGSIVTSNFDKPNQLHRYLLEVKGIDDRVKISIKPAGETLRTAMGLFDAADNLIDSSPKLANGGRGQTGRISRGALRFSRGLASPELVSPSLSADGVYHLDVFNGSGGLGRYQLLVEGILPNGKVIKPGGGGDDEAASPPGAGEAANPAGAGAPAVGFPGLPPVDFSSAVTTDLPADGTIRGKISSARDRTVRTYTYTPAKGGACEVTVRRTNGSGALGFVVLSESNQVLAQSSLVASGQVTTTLVLPDGPATLGIYQLEMSKAAAQWPTEFEVRVKATSAGGGR